MDEGRDNTLRRGIGTEDWCTGLSVRVRLSRRRWNVSRSADTAETLILIGLIFQGITLLVLVGVGLYLLIIPVLGEIVLFLAFLALIWFILVYVYSYQRTVHCYYEDARTPTLVFGILSLITGGIISGILYIVAYLKLGDAADQEEEESRRVLSYRAAASAEDAARPRPTYSLANPAPFIPSATPPSSSPVASGSNFCSSCGRPTLPQARYCRNCGATLL
jgi:hypothetical protein